MQQFGSEFHICDRILSHISEIFFFDVPVDTLLWEECSGWADISYDFLVHLQISRKRSDSVGWHEKPHGDTNAINRTPSV
jgi:hypothetical protein